MKVLVNHPTTRAATCESSNYDRLYRSVLQKAYSSDAKRSDHLRMRDVEGRSADVGTWEHRQTGKVNANLKKYGGAGAA